ncbi:MAG: tetratricopeptide repeat protein [Planctomycetota bacterium]
MRVRGVRADALGLPGRALTVVAAAAVLCACVTSGARRSERQREARRHVRAGQVMFQQGKTTKAIESIHKALEIDPALAEAYNLLGVIYLQQSDFKMAAENLRRAVEMDPYYTDAHNHLGVAYKELGKYDRAREQFETALKDASYRTREKIYLNLGYLYLKQGRGQDAVRAFGQAVALDPDYARAFLGLGRAYRLTGQGDLAGQAFRRVLELGPDTPEAATARQYLDGRAKRDDP